jgi:putative phosphoribosyl transferase
MGAIGSGGVLQLDTALVERMGITYAAILDVVKHELVEMSRRELLYRSDRPPLELTGRICVVVDDGLATGASMRAAIAGLRQRAPRAVIAAAPVAAPEACAAVRRIADQVVCAVTPDPFYAVGLWYVNFDEVPDAEVQRLLLRAAEEHSASTGAPALT